MRLLSSALITLLALTKLSFASSSSVLVVLDPSLDREDYSIFFGGLEERGYNLTFRAPKDASPAITDYGVPNYDHVILFAPDTKSYAQDITPQSLVGLLSENTNLLIALSPKQTPLTSLAAEFSLILPPPETPLISHHPARSGPPTTIPVTVSSSSPILTPGIPPVCFAADPTSDTDSDALVTASEKGGEGLWAGSQMGLVTGFQTNVNSRVVFAGGVKMFSDEYAGKELPSGELPGNALFVADVAAWVFQDKMKLRIDGVDHHRVGESGAPEMYTTSDEIVYTAHISAYDSQTSTWKPYSGIDDLQLEFTMLDPHIRTSLPAVPGSPGTYQVQFRAPDRHGVFKFVLNWKRKGYSYLESSTTVPVVPPRHDQYPRFLSAAWPYYAGAISTSVGFFLFSALWLAGDVKGERKKGSKVE
ncbi:Dolichyl-diphosphooligosaccharide--protein glycosyltransferase subunit WBP1 [Suillus subalutaceus]|uniref:Dolichyl-diphosphooligosaccharide--protein glycosyltransferase subunit WBP1 n=1 Tax=Suillus subalutaceus TaxID=48586 RepID=UPI001B87C3F8|nr:Dolichyl-diphosphooligosaccharide--protein glycosyltransferase subunit WBP1 [Suillus subalutaceus]KAG1856671.1 Dolichyl-diphosphooligosaccharide--protein glycosyltransferase subunit WBP1 [Suillus subalutaceus]